MNADGKPKRWALHKFEQPQWSLLPVVSVGRAPGAWGYPETWWVAWGWLRRTWQFSWYRGERADIEA